MLLIESTAEKRRGLKKGENFLKLKIKNNLNN